MDKNVPPHRASLKQANQKQYYKQLYRALVLNTGSMDAVVTRQSFGFHAYRLPSMTLLM